MIYGWIDFQGGEGREYSKEGDATPTPPNAPQVLVYSIIKSQSFLQLSIANNFMPVQPSGFALGNKRASGAHERDAD